MFHKEEKSAIFTQSSLYLLCRRYETHITLQSIYCVGYMIKQHLYQFPKWSTCTLQLFHRIKYLYYTSLSVCLLAATNNCNGVLELTEARSHILVPQVVACSVHMPHVPPTSKLDITEGVKYKDKDVKDSISLDTWFHDTRAISTKQRCCNALGLPRSAPGASASASLTGTKCLR